MYFLVNLLIVNETLNVVQRLRAPAHWKFTDASKGCAPPG